VASERIAKSYLAECAKVLRSGYATDERSFYPALNKLLTDVGKLIPHQLTTVPEPAAREGDFPDVAFYEERSQVLVLPVEAKPLNLDKTALLSLSQGERYARTFGGGHVLLTNFWTFIWAELDPNSGHLVEKDSLSLIADSAEIISGRFHPIPNSVERLATLIEGATSVRAVITDADQVARLLAYHAQLMVESINDADEEPQELLAPLAKSMEEGLGMHLENKFFVPTVAQTFVYGLFAAWLDSDDPSRFDWSRAEYSLHPRVMAELFHQIGDPAFVRRCDLTKHLDGAARVLRWVNRPSFEQKFDAFAIEYFYEPFLRRFDPTLRDKLGVWFTPREIAEYQVTRVHYHLQNDLGISAGLADDNVIVLDPAVGTGTYLRACIDRIYAYHVANGEPASMAARKTSRAALTRLIGFEVLPAAFVIAHLHLQRHLGHLGVRLRDDERLRVYLTNSLLGWSEANNGPMPLPGMEEELRGSSRVKTEERVLVVIGNPPYEGFSAAERDEEVALLNEWIAPLWPVYGLRKHRLGDLYVRFWRIAVKKIAELTGRGIISYITNRKWLGGRSFPVMRDCLTHEFQQILIDDLHGDVHDTTHPGDGSIFTTATAAGIQRGVAITTAIRHREADGSVAEVLLRDLRGTGEEKRALLTGYNGASLNRGMEETHPTAENQWRLVADSSGDDPGLDEYFQFFLSGVQPVRDEAVIDFDRTRLQRRMKTYFDPDTRFRDLVRRYPAFAVERMRYSPADTRRKLLEDSRFYSGRIVRFLYKPFDERWLYWEPEHKLLNEPRRELIPYYLTETENRDGFAPIAGQLAIVASQTPRRPGAARPALTSAVAGFHALDPDARIFPRIQSPTDSDQWQAKQRGLTFKDGKKEQYRAQQTNVQSKWIAALRSLKIDGEQLELGDTVFFALVAIMHSPVWIASIGTDNDDFAPVPIPEDRAAILEAAKFGRMICSLYDLQASVPGVTHGKIESKFARVAVPDKASGGEITAGSTLHGGRYVPDEKSIYWNDTDAWRGVSQEVWGYSVGGFPVLSKWLGYRHGRNGFVLSESDIETFTYLCRRIAALITLQVECDRLYGNAQAHPLKA
jgi:hypothetical protein